MAKLTTAQRQKMPASEYALPGKRFPVNDAPHAVAAERLVGRAVKAGSITPAQAATVKNKAAKKLGKLGKLGKAGNAAPGGKLAKAPAVLPHGGMDVHENMAPFDHNKMGHDSDDR